MSIDYTQYPYNKWSKCPHTCEHTTIDASRMNHAKATYEVDNETIIVGLIKVIHCNSRMLRSHSINSKSHPKCTVQCPMHNWLGNENSSNRNFKTPLIAEEWRRWGLGIALANATLETTAKDVPQEYIDRLLADFPELSEKVLAKRGERTNLGVPARAAQTRDDHAPESPRLSSHWVGLAHSSSVSPECPPSASPSTAPSTDLGPINAVHDQTASQPPISCLHPVISKPSFERPSRPTSLPPPATSTHKIVPVSPLSTAQLSESNISPLPRSSVQPSNPTNIRNILPRQPVTYQFTDWTSNSMLLIPPPTAETQIQEPVYQICASLGLNPFLPVCYVTQVRRPGGQLVGQFELSLNHRWGILTMGDVTTRISNVISSIDNNPRYMEWKFRDTQLRWDCRTTHEGGAMMCICYSRDAAATQLAIFLPPSLDASPPLAAPILTVSPNGHQDDLFDHIVISALLVERNLTWAF